MGREVKEKRAYNAALRREQAQLTRERILDAARRLLVRGTYSSVTMEEIAREAGVAYQTVYAIFRTKLGLAHAMVEAGFHFEDIDAEGAPRRSPGDPRPVSAAGRTLRGGSTRHAPTWFASCASLAIPTS